MTADARALPRLDRVDAYVDHWAAEHPDRVALVDGDGRRITYRELPDAVCRWTSALAALGVRRGDRVAALGRSSTEALLSFLACARLGAVWLGLHPKYTLDELRHNVADAAPVLLLALVGDEEADQHDKLAALARDVASVRAVTRPGAASWPHEAPPAPARPVGRRDAVALVYTSGSTGRPKGALLSHAGFVDCGLVQDDRFGAEGAPRVYNAFPINHVAWLGDVCTSTLIAGGTVVFAEQFDPEAMLAAIERERLTHLAGVPTMLLYATKAPGWRTRELSSVERVVFSGAAASPELVRELSRVAPVVTGFGMTETTGTVTFSDLADDPETIAGTVGRPHPRFEVRVVSEDGSEAADEEPGELRIRADTNFLGYHGRPDATAEAFDDDGFLRTGDQAVRRADGALRLVGRLHERFKSGGLNVYPREVELALEEHPTVREAAVVGVADPTFGEVGVAFVAGEGLDGDEVRAFARSRLADFKVPKRVEVLDALPRLPVGKPDKVTLRRRAAEATRG